jgi:hypothetical protein
MSPPNPPRNGAHTWSQVALWDWDFSLLHTVALGAGHQNGDLTKTSVTEGALNRHAFGSVFYQSFLTQCGQWGQGTRTGI